MQAVQALPASFRSSLRPVSTSNGAGSRAAGSRGPWSSAELATRPVRKGPPKPKGNAPDSRKTRTSHHRIPESGKGLNEALAHALVATCVVLRTQQVTLCYHSVRV